MENIKSKSQVNQTGKKESKERRIDLENGPGGGLSGFVPFMPNLFLSERAGWNGDLNGLECCVSPD